MNFCENLKGIRKSMHLSQASFAKALGVSFSTVNRWENGKSRPSYDAIEKISLFCKKHSLSISFDEDI